MRGREGYYEAAGNRVVRGRESYFQGCEGA